MLTPATHRQLLAMPVPYIYKVQAFSLPASFVVQRRNSQLQEAYMRALAAPGGAPGDALAMLEDAAGGQMPPAAAGKHGSISGGGGGAGSRRDMSELLTQLAAAQKERNAAADRMKALASELSDAQDQYLVLRADTVRRTKSLEQQVRAD